MPPRFFVGIGTPMTGNVVSREHPGKVSAAARSGDDHLDAARSVIPTRSAMSRPRIPGRVRRR